MVGSGIASLALSLASGSLPLLATVGVSLVLGILYSTELPFMRWKRSPVLAAGCILVVRWVGATWLSHCVMVMEVRWRAVQLMGQSWVSFGRPWGAHPPGQVVADR